MYVPGVSTEPSKHILFLAETAEQVEKNESCPSQSWLATAGIWKSQVIVELMTRWNDNNTQVQDSASVCHTWAKNNLGHWQRWSPNAVYNRDQSSAFMNYSTFSYSECTQRTKCNERISPWVCSLVDAQSSNPPGCLPLSCPHVSDRTSQSPAHNTGVTAVFSNLLPVA